MRLANRAKGLGEGVDGMVFRDVARVEMGLRDPVIVPLQKAPQDLGQMPARHRVEPADNAEVDRGDLRRCGDEQIALVKVGVKHPVIHRLGEEGADEVVGEGRAIQAR